jgi:hypothetical protein
VNLAHTLRRRSLPLTRTLAIAPSPFHRFAIHFREETGTATIHATDAVLSQDVSFTLNVGDFAMSIDPPVISVLPTDFTTFNLNLTSIHNFDGDVLTLAQPRYERLMLSYRAAERDYLMNVVFDPDLLALPSTTSREATNCSSSAAASSLCSWMRMASCSPENRPPNTSFARFLWVGGQPVIAPPLPPDSPFRLKMILGTHHWLLHSPMDCSGAVASGSLENMKSTCFS